MVIVTGIIIIIITIEISFKSFRRITLSAIMFICKWPSTSILQYKALIRNKTLSHLITIVSTF